MLTSIVSLGEMADARVHSDDLLDGHMPLFGVWRLLAVAVTAGTARGRGDSICC